MYYAQPQLRESKELRDLFRLPVGFTRDMPGARLAMAVDHYTIEAYARRSDRDAACGATAHPDITYAAVAASCIKKTDEIGCGYAFDHPDFEKVLDPIFSRSVERLIANMMAAGQKAEDPIAIEILSIARNSLQDRSHRRARYHQVSAQVERTVREDRSSDDRKDVRLPRGQAPSALLADAAEAESSLDPQHLPKQRNASSAR